MSQYHNRDELLKDYSVLLYLWFNASRRATKRGTEIQMPTYVSIIHTHLFSQTRKKK